MKKIEDYKSYKAKWPEHAGENPASHLHCGECKATLVRLYRPYGTFLRDEDQRCSACVGEDWSWIVPCVSDINGSVWGYTSCREEDIQRWLDLPENGTKPPRWSDWFGKRKHAPKKTATFEEVDALVCDIGDLYDGKPGCEQEVLGALAYYGWGVQEYNRADQRRMNRFERGMGEE